MEPNQFPVVVTTVHRGVFFGYLAERPRRFPSELRLEGARMCLVWPAEVRGVLGLAHSGPLKGSRVGPLVPAIFLTGITAVMEMTPQAVAAWEAGPWQ